MNAAKIADVLQAEYSSLRSDVRDFETQAMASAAAPPPTVASTNSTLKPEADCPLALLHTIAAMMRTPTQYQATARHNGTANLDGVGGPRKVAEIRALPTSHRRRPTRPFACKDWWRADSAALMLVAQSVR